MSSAKKKSGSKSSKSTSTTIKRSRAVKKKKSDAIAFLDSLIGEPMTLGRFIRSHREDEGLSLADMAKTLGVSRQHLHAVEIGKSTVSVERAIRWARLLGYVDELLAELALQAEVSAAGLKCRVKLEAVA